MKFHSQTINLIQPLPETTMNDIFILVKIIPTGITYKDMVFIFTRIDNG